jgi:putative ABC transport system permease protein
LRAAALGAFEKTFAVTTAIELIAILVAIVGLVTTLLAQLLDRRGELLTLNYLGIAPSRIARMVFIEAGLLAATGIIVGAIAGVALSWILTTRIMMVSFGWTIDFELQPIAMARIAALVLTAALAAAFIPARMARGTMTSRYAQTMAG